MATLYTIIGTISGVIIGWALSLLNKKWEKKREIDDFMNGLSAELNDVKLVFTMLSIELLSKAKMVDRKTFDWAISMIEENENQLVEKEEEILEEWKKIMKLEDFEKAWLSMYMAEEKKSIGLTPIKTPFFESKINNIPSLDQALRNLVIKVYRRINNFNEQVESYNIHYFKTFDANLTEGNYKIIERNIRDSHKHLGVQARMIVDEISGIQKALR
ncbi:MAG: hypothetical protein AMQ22_02263 [Candidatus Methanofastidiosum methylothiophilum]|uniref:Uncharacterized protein n=1 Tax=Candidatus Methanofastidiosum methylothiophilum TaxID=1705564 RepID=A0A150IJA7_9EURY|nr:MAG: hypothetical protein AMQ22_02263 [Candidatus Methanofastidiosum methylthiophilus]